MIAELRRALVEAGASEPTADAAAAAVASVGEVATKADLAALKVDLAALEARLTWRLVGAVAVILAALALDL